MIVLFHFTERIHLVEKAVCRRTPFHRPYGCESDVSLTPKVETYHSGYHATSSLSVFFQRDDDLPDHYSGFFPLQTGHDALLTRLAMIESASNSLDLQYYIFRDDETSSC
nr:hypothetical protein [Enterovibrio nigricans]